MRDPALDPMRLEHILEACDALLDGRKRYTFEQAMADTIVFHGFVKKVEVIGEAVYMLTREFQAEHPVVDWAIIEKMRHVLVHDYYQIKPLQLWKTIDTDIAPLRPIIQTLYDEITKSTPQIPENHVEKLIYK